MADFVGRLAASGFAVALVVLAWRGANRDRVSRTFILGGGASLLLCIWSI